MPRDEFGLESSPGAIGSGMEEGWGAGVIDKGRMAEMLGLTYGEHLMIWTLRRLVARRGLCALTMKEFTEACGAGAPQVLATFQGFLAIAGHANRRAISVGYPGFVGLTPDERSMIALIGAAQAGLQARLSAHLLWQAKPEARDDLGIAAQALARMFATHDLTFSVPQAPDTPACHSGREPRPALWLHALRQ